MGKMKKTISFILIVFMLLSVVPVQIFAAGPTLEKVEFIDNTPISNQYIQNCYALNPDTNVQQILYSVSSDYEYYYKLYFSNGKTLDTQNGNYPDEYWLCGINHYFVTTYVDAAACQKAIDEGKSTVKVKVCVELDKLVGKDETLSFEVEKEIVPGYVKSIKLIGDIPKGLGYGEYIAEKFNGREVEIEYYDGRKEIAEIVCKEKDTPFCYINDELASLLYVEYSDYDEESGESFYYKSLRIDYLDIETDMAKVETKCPFEEIKLLDYKFDGKGNLTEVTYRLTCKDGRVIEKTCSVNGTKGEYGQVVIDTVDEYDVVVYLYMTSTYYDVVIEIEDFRGVFDYVDGSDATDACDCICHKNGIMYIFGFIMVSIWKLFRINQYCKCNASHWE